ncbi:MAG: hypothetical protein K8T89_24720 [Planctomycetes bacterium]|nr:hypothetical protein [Planctomycetota bacterium]
MKKLLCVCALGLFLIGGVIGCGGSTTSPAAATGGSGAAKPTGAAPAPTAAKPAM